MRQHESVQGREESFESLVLIGQVIYLLPTKHAAQVQNFPTYGDLCVRSLLCGRSRVRAPDRTNTQGLKITEQNVLPL